MMNDGELTRLTGQSPDTIHHTLRASRRRLVVVLIAHHVLTGKTIDPAADEKWPLESGQDVVTTRSLAKTIVAIEENIETHHATGSEYHNCYTALCQTHLPLLDDVGAIEYDPDRKVIRGADNLLSLSVIATITSNLAQMIFHDSIARLYTAGKVKMAEPVRE